MSSEVLTQAVGPAAPAAFGQGRIFNLLSAPGGPVTITCDNRNTKGGQTALRRFVNVPAGTKFVAPLGSEWTYLRLTSASNQLISIFVGDEDLQFNNAVTVTGTASVSLNPSSTINAPAASVLAGSTTDGTGVPANPARRRVTIYNLTTGAGGIIRVSDTGVTGRGFEISPGQDQEVDTTAALGIRCDTATGTTWGYFEES